MSTTARTSITSTVMQACMRAVAGAVLLIGLLGSVNSASAQSLAGTFSKNAPFPDRQVVLSVPQGVNVTPSKVQVTENGVPVTSLTARSLASGRDGKLGVVIVVDSDPTMAGAPIEHAMEAARTLASERTGNQLIGAVFGDGRTLPLTTDQSKIDSFLASPPQIVGLTNLQGATQTAISQLESANVISRAVIYVSDDIDQEQGITPQALAAIASAAHVRIYSVAIHDFATDHPSAGDLPLSAMKTLAEAAGGTFAEAEPTQLRGIFRQIEAGLTSQYVVGYRSAQPYGEQVDVSVSVAGVEGALNFAYTAPIAPVVKPAKPKPHHHPQQPAVKVVHQSFWASSLAVVIVAFIAAALFALALAVVLSHYARSRELRKRVVAFVPDRNAFSAAGIIDARESKPVWTRLLEGQRWWPGFIHKVDVGNIQRTPESLVGLAIAGSVVAALVLDVLTGSVLLAIAGLAVGPLVLRAIVNRKLRQQRTLFMEQLPGQLHEVASAMRTGRSIVEAVRVVADNADEPTRREFERALADERAGIHIEDALRPVGERMQSTEIEQVAVVAALHRRTGANITEVLDRVAATARQRVEIRRELLALTAQARLTRNVLTALPIVVATVVNFIGQGYERPLFHSRAGIIVLCIGTAMLAIGSKVMKKIVDIEE